MRGVLILALAAVTATGAGVARSAASDTTWLPRYDFMLEVDGKSSPEALFYQESNGRRILVCAPELPKHCILDQTGKKVLILGPSEVTFEAEGEAARTASAAEAAAQTSSYNIDGGRVLFYVGNNRLKIAPKQHLEGPTTADAIVRHSPLYKKGAEEYTPQQADVSYLKSITSPIQIEVFLGTWCPHCKVLVPKFMKSIDLAANPNLRVSYVAVPRGFDTYPAARAKSVTGIPTFIFYRNGSEFGRIPGEPTQGSIERAMVEILRGTGK